MRPECPEGDSKESETSPDTDDGSLFQNPITGSAPGMAEKNALSWGFRRPVVPSPFIRETLPDCPPGGDRIRWYSPTGQAQS